VNTPLAHRVYPAGKPISDVSHWTRLHHYTAGGNSTPHPGHYALSGSLPDPRLLSYVIVLGFIRLVPCPLVGRYSNVAERRYLSFVPLPVGG